MRTADQLVSAEVHYCVSSLVATLAHGCTGIAPENTPLIEMCEQAIELASPIPDYEEAAIQAGWGHVDDGDTSQNVYRDTTDGQTWCAKDWAELCSAHDIEPCDREVFEHWIVSDWLAEKLAAKGEKVDADFAGLTVWARTTTGQAISIDSVIVDIVADLVREYGE